MKRTEELECITDPERAVALMHPLRLSVLREARDPVSATEIAGRLGLPRQRVNYHVRALADGGFLRRAGRRRKRNMTEQRYVAVARAFVLSPELLGGAGPEQSEFQDRFSAATLLALASQLLGELGRARAEATSAGKRLATLSVSSAFRFETPEQRAHFAAELERAVLEVVERCTSPATSAGGGSAAGRPYRLLVGSWPIPPEGPREEPKAEEETS